MSTKSKYDQPIVIKKYANRRLYDTGRSSYVTLDDLCEMVKKSEDFVVYDAKTGDDLTRQVLTQIIVEQEGKGQNLLPTNFLRQLIHFYGDNIQSLVPNYLEHTMQAFSHQQEKMRENLKNMQGSMQGMPGMFPVGNLEELSKQNMAMFENAMRAFGNFSQAAQDAGSKTQSAASDLSKTLEKEIERLQKELNKLK